MRFSPQQWAARVALLLVALFHAAVATVRGDVIIAEFDALNIGSATDADGSQTDWIELRNTGPTAVNLTGWALSDDPAIPGKWLFPATNLAASSQLLVFASGKDRAISGVQLHTNFKLAESGSLFLSQPDGGGGWTVVHSITNYPEQRPGLSFGLTNSVPNGALGYFETPTANAVNGASVVTSFVADTGFNPNRGFYDAPFNVVVTSATPGATIIYTTNGTEPTSSNGTQVAAPDAFTAPAATIAIAGTTVLRARAIKSGLGQTNVDTHTYIFPAQVLGQNESYVTLPFANWGHDKGDANTTQAEPGEADWSMDPRVTNHANPEDRCVASDLQTIPTISIVLNWTEMFGTGGIYIAGENIEKRASFEIVNPAGDVANPNLGGQQQNGFLTIFGGTSTSRWKSDKLSMRFKFWTDFSSGILGDAAIGDYDTLVLDARLNQVWTHSQDGTQRNRGDYARDLVVSDFENAIGNHGTHGRHVHVYINGLFWGLYTLHERPDEHFAADYFGGNDDDYDVVKHGPANPNYLVAGRRINPSLPISNTNHTAGVNYQALLNLAAPNMATQANYDALAAKLDIPAFVNYMLLNFYAGNDDWAHQNWYASYNRVRTDGKWRFHSWDAEHVFKTNNYDATVKDDPTGPTSIHQNLAANGEYRRIFGDAAHKLLFNNGPFTPSAAKSIFDARLMDINEAIRAESARWGDNGPQGITSPSAELHLRFSNVTTGGTFVSWWNERLRILNTVLDGAQNRTVSLISQLRARGLYPSLNAPLFAQHGGIVPANYNLAMSNPNATGTIYYTTDGTDPRVAFTGAINPAAASYSGAIALTTSRTIKARILDGANWSALNEADFSVGTVAAAAGNLVISKIHYRPAPPTAAEIAAGFSERSDFEFIEVMNVSNNRITLDGVSFSAGLDVAPLANGAGVRELDPGARALYVAKLAAFQFRFGSALPIAGTFALGSNLDNNGESLTLVASDGSTIVHLTYANAAPWPAQPDGNGPSLVLIHPGVADPALAYNWRASTGTDGSPAADDRLRFASWQAAHFSPADPGYPAVAEPSADPESDGLENLAELFFGSDPKVPTPEDATCSVGIQAFAIGDGPAQPYAVFIFRHVKAAEEIVYVAETSTDFATWQNNDLILVDPPLDHGDGTETRTYRTAQPLSAETAPVRAFRLKLTLP
jgi:hypothetical protein